MQQEITQAKPLLDEKGYLLQKGYAKKMLPIYNKRLDFKSRFKTKEWDYYFIGNKKYGVCLTIDDNGYMGLDSISFLDFTEKWEITKSPMQVMTLGKKKFPATSITGDIEYRGKDYFIKFENKTTSRHLTAYMENFKDGKSIDIDIELTNIPEESMVIVTPFNKNKHFYFNQKINCMTAKGIVTIGDQAYGFSPTESFGTLDWGRGIWTYKNTWYWGSLSTSVDGVPFGFNIGYGFGDTSAASENMLFYNGKAHKLDQVTFNIPLNEKGKEKYLEPWTFTSNDNRLNLTFEPILNRSSCTDVLIIKSDQNQVFGKFSGDCILDDGTVIHLNKALGFAEKVSNKW